MLQERHDQPIPPADMDFMLCYCHARLICHAKTMQAFVTRGITDKPQAEGSRSQSYRLVHSSLAPTGRILDHW